MKNILLFLFFFLLGCCGVVLFQYIHLNINTSIPNVFPISSFSLSNAPTQSLKATVTSLSGDIFWQSRISPQFIPIQVGQTLQQGETLATKEKSKVQITFPQIAMIQLSSNTILNLIQTLPVTIVVNQTQGTTLYNTLSSSVPLSVRGLDLLVVITSGSSQIHVDSDNQIITVSVLTGKAKALYNDTNFVSHVVNLVSGDVFVFDDNQKEYTLQ